MHVKALIAVLLLTLSVVYAAYSESDYQDAFVQWMQQYGKSYSHDEFQMRYQAFRQNMDFVASWNANPQAHRVALNLFADLTNAEYQQLYLGTHFDGTERIASAKPSDSPLVKKNTTVDWRLKGAVTPIKNQGQCGSCWSFSTTGSTEGIHFLSTGNLVSLSEQNLVDCSQNWGNAGCNGGLMDDAFQYIIDNKGIDTEASYPYTAETGTCQFSSANVGATLSSYTDVTSGDETALANAVTKQPISVAIDASHASFQFYTSGIYYEPACSSTQLDHGVLAIGYGDGFWWVKNSWGTSWGQTGYIQMTRGDNNNCGIATMASYPAV